MNGPLPAYIYDDSGKRCWLTLRPDIQGRWQACYIIPQAKYEDVAILGPLVTDGDSPQDAIEKLAELRKDGL